MDFGALLETLDAEARRNIHVGRRPWPAAASVAERSVLGDRADAFPLLG